MRSNISKNKWERGAVKPPVDIPVGFKTDHSVSAGVWPIKASDSQRPHGHGPSLFHRAGILICLMCCVGLSSRTCGQSADGDWLLFDAVLANDLASIDSLIRAGADVNQKDESGTSPLMMAAQEGFVEVASRLLEAGANVNEAPWNGLTPLHAAVRSGHLPMARLLLANGADPNPSDRFSRTPLHYSVVYGDFFMTDLLVASKADVVTVDNQGICPLSYACWAGAYESAALLLDQGAYANQADLLGRTPLHFAMAASDSDIVDLLLRHQGSVDQPDKRGYSPLGLAVLYDNPTWLIQFQAAHKTSSPLAHSPSKLAWYLGNRPMARLLAKTNGPFRGLILSQIEANLVNRFNSRDYFIGAGTGFYESRYKVHFLANFLFRPASRKVWVPADPSNDFQFREKRYVLGVGVRKDFNLVQTRAGFLGIQAACHLAWSWSFNRGTSFRQKSLFFPEPQIGVFLKDQQWGLALSWVEGGFGYHPIPDRYLELGLQFYINRMFRQYRAPDLEIL